MRDLAIDGKIGEIEKVYFDAAMFLPFYGTDEAERSPAMEINEACEVIFMEARCQGEPLTMDVALAIAKKLVGPRFAPADGSKPGNVARYHRERYEGMTEEETLAALVAYFHGRSWLIENDEHGHILATVPSDHAVVDLTELAGYLSPKQSDPPPRPDPSVPFKKA
jgi:hypothetical protein